MSKSTNEGFLLIRKFLKWQGAFTLCLSVTLFLAAPLLISLAYGKQYDASVPVLMLMAWLPFIVGLSNIFGIQTLLVLGHKEIFSKILMMSGIVNVILILPLTYFNGAVGAATSVLLTEIIVTTLMIVVIIKKKIPLFKGNLHAV